MGTYTGGERIFTSSDSSWVEYYEVDPKYVTSILTKNLLVGGWENLCLLLVLKCPRKIHLIAQEDSLFYVWCTWAKHRYSKTLRGREKPSSKLKTKEDSLLMR